MRLNLIFKKLVELKFLDQRHSQTYQRAVPLTIHPWLETKRSCLQFSHMDFSFQLHNVSPPSASEVNSIKI